MNHFIFKMLGQMPQRLQRSWGCGWIAAPVSVARQERRLLAHGQWNRNAAVGLEHDGVRRRVTIRVGAPACCRAMVLHRRAMARVVGRKLESWPTFVCATALVQGFIFSGDNV
jgi:hypothetical protein